MHISIWLDDLHEQTTADFLRKTRTRGLWGVGVADCLWQSLCDLTESGDESRPLQIFGVKPERLVCMIRLMYISIWLDDLHEQTTADFLRKTPNGWFV